MKRLIGYTAALCLLAIMIGCGGVANTGTLAYVSNSTGTGFTVFTVNTDGTLTKSSISPQNTPSAPKVLQFSPNGKWAYFLDQGGANIFAFTRSGNGQLATNIADPATGKGAFSVNGQGSSLVITPNSSFLYVSLPGGLTPKLAAFSIDQATGSLSSVPLQNAGQIGFAISQLVMSPGGNILYGLAPSQQSVLSWTLNSSSGVVTLVGTLPVGINPSYLVLSANGSFLYVLDHVSDPTLGTNIFAFSQTGGILTALPGSPFHGNPDAVTQILPTNPVAGATSNDSRFLFVANQGSHNISAFKINTTTGGAGGLTEVLGSTTTVNGIAVSTASPFDCGSGCSAPAFVAVSISNNALYVLDTAASKIFQFQINQNTGRLRALNPASVAAETATSSPTFITIR